MSLHPQAVPPVPEETTRVARAACPHGTLAMRLRDHLGALYDDTLFAALFSPRGQPAEAPWRLALVTVLQYAAGLSDRQAAEAVRVRVDWKYALSLELTDPGFDYSVLSEFRARLITGNAEHHLLDALLACCREHGLLKARGRQRTDSTHVLAAIRALNRLTCVGETLRHALNRLAEVAPDWLRAQVPADWFDRYSLRFEEYRLPTGQAERAALAATIGADGVQLLSAVYASGAPPQVRQVPAVEILRQVWVQQYYAPQEGTVRWRDARDIPPGALMINSPYDAEARYATKRSTTWVGYKVHVSETCEDDEPHLITHVETTAATTPDNRTLEAIHAGLATKDLLPAEHFLDSGYIESELILSSRMDYGVELYGPIKADTSWQAQAGQGFDVACFRVDWERCVVTCPRGKASHQWKPTRDHGGHAVIHVEFARQECAPCPCRSQCTRSQTEGREVTLRPREQYDIIRVARARQQTATFKEEYATRAGVEGTLSQGVRVCDLRRARYIGLARTRLQHIATATAINLHRLDDWWSVTPRAQTRQSAFAVLAAA